MLDSILPEFKNTKVHYYAAPCMGAKFLECKLIIEKDGGSKEAIVNGYENFMYVISGEVEVLISGKKHTMEAEGYFWRASHGGLRDLQQEGRDCQRAVGPQAL